MPNPIYDVVIPIYKVQPEWIVECLDSVLAQKIQAWRVIIVDGTPSDDDMADAIAAVCLDYVNSDPRFHYLKQDADVEGVGGARNQAIAYGNSPWVAFLDGDDYWYPDHLSFIQEVLDGESNEISGVKVIDDRNIQIKIDSPKAYFLAKLTYPTAYVLNEANVNQGGDNWTDSPVVTGPFALERYDLGQVLILKRNDLYWGEKAKLDRVEFNLAGGVPMAMYENGEIDITGVGLADLERVQDQNDPLSKDLISVPPSFTINYIGFNVSKPPFDDIKFRQALNYAVDKQLIATQVYSELVRPAYGILPPNFPGFSSDVKGLVYDPDKAVKLLNESKYADPETRPLIVVTIPGTGGSPSLDMEVVADMWDRVLGVQIDFGGICNVQPDMDVRSSPVMPDEGGTFEAPIVPDAVVAKIVFFVKGEIACIQSALLLECSQCFFSVLQAIGFQE